MKSGMTRMKLGMTGVKAGTRVLRQPQSEGTGWLQVDTFGVNRAADVLRSPRSQAVESFATPSLRRGGCQVQPPLSDCHSLEVCTNASTQTVSAAIS